MKRPGVESIHIPINFIRLPEVDELAELLQDSQAWSYVVALWMWTAELQPDGCLDGLSNRLIAARAGFLGDPSMFVGALINAGFLDDETRRLAWWEIVFGHPVVDAERRLKDRLRKERERSKRRRADARGEPRSIAEADAE